MFYRQLPALTSLETLQMRNTQRTLNNFPLGVDTLANLQGKNFQLGVDTLANLQVNNFPLDVDTLANLQGNKFPLAVSCR